MRIKTEQIEKFFGDMLEERMRIMNKGYVVFYSNEGRPERTPTFVTRELAEVSAKFLKRQGAKNVRIRWR